MNDESLIVDIRVPDTIDLVLLQTLKAANAIRDANRRREEQTKYRESVKEEEPDDYEEQGTAAHNFRPSTSSEHEKDDDEDFISYAMRMMKTPESDPDYEKHMVKKRMEFQNKNGRTAIKQSMIVKNSLVEANREYEYEKKSRTEQHFRKSSAQKYFPDKRRTHTSFDESILHNLKNPLIAAVYHGNCDEFFRYIYNCPQSGMRMPDRNKCLCISSFSQAYDNPVLLALSSYIHQKECDHNGGCGRVSCKNDNDYLEIILRLFKECDRNYHIKELVATWFCSSPLYAQLCPLSLCLYYGRLDLFEKLVHLIYNSDIEVSAISSSLRRSRSLHDLLEQSFIEGVTPVVQDLVKEWRSSLKYMKHSRIFSCGRLEAVMSILGVLNEPDHHIKSIRRAAFQYDYPNYLNIFLKSSGNKNMLEVFDNACCEGAEKCLQVMRSNQFWMSEILNAENCKTTPFDVLLKVSRIYDRDLFYLVKDLVLHSREFSNFPFTCETADLLFHLACGNLWAEFTDWLRRLEGTSRMKQKYAKAQEDLNLTFRYFIFSNHFPEKMLLLILDTLIAAGAYIENGENDFALMKELKKKNMLKFLKYRESSCSRYIIDLEQEMSKLSIDYGNSNQAVRRFARKTSMEQEIPYSKKPRLY